MNILLSTLLLLLLVSPYLCAMTFTSNGRGTPYTMQGPPGTAPATVTSAVNGLLVTITATTATNKYAWITSDMFSPTYTPADYYVTLVCANTAVDFGVVVGPTNQLQTKLLGSPGTIFTDLASLDYPAKLDHSYTTSPGIVGLSQVIKWTTALYSGQSCMEIKAVDYSTGQAVGRTYNAGGVCETGHLRWMDNSQPKFFGFEVLNCGQATFCIQTAAQVAAGAGNCDNGATTSSSCSSTTCADETFTCPSGTLTNGVCASPCNSPCAMCRTGTSSPCVTCSAAYPLLYNGNCYNTCPAATTQTATNDGCIRCSSSCASCRQGAPAQCVTCSGSSPLLYNSTCYSSCPNGTTQATTNDGCVACNSACASCVAGTSSQCLTCSGLYPLLYNNSCYATCPTGTIKNATNNNTCIIPPPSQQQPQSSNVSSYPLSSSLSSSPSPSSSSSPSWKLKLAIALPFSIAAASVLLYISYRYLRLCISRRRKNNYTPDQPKTNVDDPSMKASFSQAESGSGRGFMKDSNVYSPRVNMSGYDTSSVNISIKK